MRPISELFAFIYPLSIGKEEEPKMIGAQALPQPAPAAQPRTKDDAYDQFMKEMEGLI